jgi:hypothetical protein
LLPDREVATVRVWLADHPGITIQVADRWHLMENACSAFLDAVRRSMRAIRSAIGSTTITPELLHLGRKAAIRELSAARGYKYGDRDARQGRRVDQADCPPPGS